MSVQYSLLNRLRVSSSSLSTPLTTGSIGKYAYQTHAVRRITNHAINRTQSSTPLTAAHSSSLPLATRFFSSFTNPSSAASTTSSSSAASGGQTISDATLRFLRSVSSILLARVPKGWERFFPPDSTDVRPRNTTKEGEDGNNNNNAGSGGGEGQGSKIPRKPNNMNPEPSPGQYLTVILGFAFFLLMLNRSSSGDEVTFQDFKTRYLETRKVEKLEVDMASKKVNIVLRNSSSGASSSSPSVVDSAQNITGGSVEQTNNNGQPSTLADLFFGPRQGARPFFYIGSVETFERHMEEAQRAQGIDPHDFVSIKYEAVNSNLKNWVDLAGTLVFLGVSIYIFRNMGMGMGGGGGKKGNNPFSFGKSTAQLIKPGDSKITFKDVAGLDDAKVEVLEFVKFLQNPERFTRLGAKIPKGALLCGPPGTGKTLLAKAVAGEAGVPFYSISGSDFLEMFVGVGPSRVRDLFAQARAAAPSIIFIDEIDAVGRARSKSGYGGGNDERENTLNQMLVEMDGMNTTEGVVVLAGTNRKDMLDKALLRPGRFDRHITIDKPDMKGRAQIFMVHLANLKTDAKHTKPDLSQRLAALTPGFAGADIANLCNEAALIAARADKPAIELADFEKASDRVIGGLEKKSSPMSPEEKALVAHHEAGHAVAAWFLEHADPLLKVTIVPRGNGALGFAQYLPKELSLYHQGQLSDMMAMALGGRAAEQIFFGRVSTGASDDLQKVTRIAQAQITTYGMSERLGNVSYAPGQDDNQFVKPYSEATAQAIDEEVRSLVSKTYQRVLELLEKHRSQVKALADKLIETENVNHDVLLSLLGPRPFPSDAYTLWRKQSSEAEELLRKAAEEKKKKEDEASAASAHPDGPQLSPA